MNLMYKFHVLYEITEINKLFDYILIIWLLSLSPVANDKPVACTNVGSKTSHYVTHILAL